MQVTGHDRPVTWQLLGKHAYLPQGPLGLGGGRQKERTSCRGKSVPWATARPTALAGLAAPGRVFPST